MRLTDNQKEEIIKELLKKYRNFVLKIAYSFVRGVHRAEDITQDVFIDAYKALDKLKDYDKLSTWLKAVTRNKCVDFIKKNNAKIISMDEYQNIEMKANGRHRGRVMDRIYERETSAIIMRIIDSLPDTQRQALILRHTKHVSYKEIAEILGTTITALKSILFRARRTIRREMDRIENCMAEDVQ